MPTLISFLPTCYKHRSADANHSYPFPITRCHFYNFLSTFITLCRHQYVSNALHSQCIFPFPVKFVLTRNLFREIELKMQLSLHNHLHVTCPHLLLIDPHICVSRPYINSLTPNLPSFFIHFINLFVFSSPLPSTLNALNMQLLLSSSVVNVVNSNLFEL